MTDRPGTTGFVPRTPVPSVMISTTVPASTLAPTALSATGILSLSTASLLKKAAYHGTDDRIILDFGTFSCKAGFSWEPAPRHAFVPGLAERTLGSASGNHMSPYLIEHQSSARYSSFLASVLRTIFNQILLTDAKNKHVVICESLLAPLELKRTLASILFYRFIVKSISFVPSPYVALMATGQTTGLVIDCGFKETCVLPVVSGFSLIACSKSVSLAGCCVTARLRTLVRKHGHIVERESDASRDIDVDSNPIHLLDNMSDLFWETLKTTVVVAHPDRADWRSYMIVNANTNAVENQSDPRTYLSATLNSFHTIKFPTWVAHAAVDVLFEGNEEGESLQSCLLRTLLKCPIATRTDLLQNAFVCGGTFSIPGLEDRLKYEVEHLADESPEFHNVRRLASKMNYINSPFQPSQRAWVGGSLVGSVKIKTAFDVSREEFIEHGTVPDWSMI
ncbi:hypothetical protein BSLG_009423 [Batrachochytrium salamandrivorans]|nr:hypothetical protein BSLG_009423 [Batrachochytrium salamandrivorans]